MHFSRRSTLSILLSLFAIAAVVGGYAVIGARSAQTAKAHAAAPHVSLNCASNTTYCTEVADSESVFG